MIGHYLTLTYIQPVYVHQLTSFEPYILSKEPYILSKKPYIAKKEPYILPEKPYYGVASASRIDKIIGLF